VAGTGGQGLEALRTGAFDCMILDLNLPDMTSLDLLRTLPGSVAGSTCR